MLRIHFRGAAQVVVASRNVQADEERAGMHPSHMLGVVGGLAGEFRQVDFLRVEKLPDPGEALQGIEAGAMAIGPFVVAQDEDKGRGKTLELALARLEPFVGAGAVAAGDVAQVHHEGGLRSIDLVDHGVEQVRVRLGVGRVTQKGERKALNALCACASSGGEERRGEEKADHSFFRR